MALLQLSEPGQATNPHERRLAAGIDLGTTNSLIASVRSGVAETLPDENGEHLLPSVVQYLDGQPPRIGALAKENLVQDPLNTIASVKRFMGRAVDDIKRLGSELPYRFRLTDSSVPRIVTRCGDFSAVEVSAEILKELRHRGEATLGGELSGVVITVPAYFDDGQRQATKDAAKLAGLNVLRLLSEPTAAAIAYGLDREAEGVYAVFDLGGGTFDISILRLNRGVFEVLATGGDSALGGDDMDHAVAEWILREAGVNDGPDHRMQRQLLRAACEAKEALTTRESVEIRIDLGDKKSWTGTLSRVQFEALIEPLVQRTLTACRRALRDASLRTADIRDVVMVGGATRVPRVRTAVGEFFGRTVLTDIDPDKVVAIGAAIQADILVGNKPDSEMLLLDVIPLSLGVETMGGLVEHIIPRNTTIPVSRAQEFTTYKDGQTAMAVHVVQGERDLVSACRSLAHFELRGIPPMVAGAARIRITYQVDADGLLSVTALETKTGTASSVQVKPSYGLSDTEVEQMLRDSFDHASDDASARALRELQVDADRLIDALGAALDADGRELLSSEERNAIDAALDELRIAKSGVSTDAIRRAIEAVDRASADFAARRMNAGIRKALAGKTLADVKKL